MWPYTLRGGILVNKRKALFICVHNSARSQMAEAFLKQMAGDKFDVESAGLEPGKLNPIVVEAMKEVEIDISQNKTKSVFDLYKQGKQYDYVITVCDESQSGACPVFPGKGERLHWGFDDPSGFQGTWEEKLERTREVRDKIRRRIIEWLNEK
ncbi:MAG TPA: arsenate reductase ArsC [Candidatus Omnitrophota bacterium]|nr:arsenate reductase ArsC [Candidatus Omnitrophota bacterium]